ncbi:MAG: hypothetical protein J7521_01885 [Caulobacter sp.]|nr:hypothetical protein [Caulobacter sp.]
MSLLLGLLAALAWPIPMIVALVLTALTRGLRYKILWAVLSFVGVGAFWMRQSTGEWGFVPFALNILGPGFAPGYFKATVPLGAFVVIWMMLRVRKGRTPG